MSTIAGTRSLAVASGPDYRPDIDGLRAIAVLSVLFSHVPGRLLPGGYLGVDIFFVISGYLITRMIWRQIDAGTFSLKTFYWRRARRILPALLALLVVLTVVAGLFFSPVQRAGFGYSALATLGFGQNIFAYIVRPDNPLRAGGHPLGHSWSLAVEEQFYLVFPLFCLLAFRFGRKPGTLALLAGTGLSLAVYVAAMETGHYITAFLMLPTRAWELGMGGLVALLGRSGGAFPVVSGAGAARGWLGGFGLVLVLAAIALGGPFAAKPWPAVLAVCTGTALLILAGERPGGLAGRLLSLRPLLFVGLISYSLYLWHWPLLSVPRLVLARGLTVPEGLGCAALSVLLAWLSWKYVERPVREEQVRPALAIVLMAATAGVTAIALFAMILLS